MSLMAGEIRNCPSWYKAVVDEERIVFRRANSDDAERAMEIVFPTLRSYGIEPDPERLDSDFVTFGNNASRNVQDFVVEVDGRVQGVMAISIEDPKQPKITGLYVATEARRKGLGRSLLRHAIYHARASGARSTRAFQVDEQLSTVLPNRVHEGLSMNEVHSNGRDLSKTDYVNIRVYNEELC
jgi:GNAT superfamily N-acetyltransferase